MRFALAFLFLGIAALLVYMAYYAVLNVADEDLSYIAVAIVELAAAGAAGTAGFLALRRN